MKKSDFGIGLTYCLGLFLCHSERDYLITEEDKAKGIINKPPMWFYGAADHMFDLELSSKLPKTLNARITKFRNKVLAWRLPMDKKDYATEKDKCWAIQEAKDLLRLIDKANGIKTQKGEWE